MLGDHTNEAHYRAPSEEETRQTLHPAELKLWDAIKAYGLAPEMMLKTDYTYSHRSGYEQYWAIGMKLPQTAQEKRTDGGP